MHGPIITTLFGYENGLNQQPYFFENRGGTREEG